VSQCDRVLAVLRDGRKHTIEEIHERAGTMRLNSRVADLRRKGHVVLHKWEQGHHVYWMLDEAEAKSEARDGDLALSLRGSGEYGADGASVSSNTQTLIEGPARESDTDPARSDIPAAGEMHASSIADPSMSDLGLTSDGSLLGNPAQVAQQLCLLEPEPKGAYA